MKILNRVHYIIKSTRPSQFFSVMLKNMGRPGNEATKTTSCYLSGHSLHRYILVVVFRRYYSIAMVLESVVHLVVGSCLATKVFIYREIFDLAFHKTD